MLEYQEQYNIFKFLNSYFCFVQMQVNSQVVFGCGLIFSKGSLLRQNLFICSEDVIPRGLSSPRGVGVKDAGERGTFSHQDLMTGCCNLLPERIGLFVHPGVNPQPLHTYQLSEEWRGTCSSLHLWVSLRNASLNMEEMLQHSKIHTFFKVSLGNREERKVPMKPQFGQYLFNTFLIYVRSLTLCQRTAVSIAAQAR